MAVKAVTVICVWQLVLLKKLLTCVVFGFSTVAVLPRLPTTLITGRLCPLFTMLHCMQCSIGNHKAARPSVCPSIKDVNFDKTNKTSAQILIPCERLMRLVF